MSKHLEELNERQREAVLWTDGPLLIIAGAGAGKTKTIAHRILHLIQKGVAPPQILAITFTNKAAREMRERIHGLLAADKTLNFPITLRERPFISTFHSLGVHILREKGSLLGIPRRFTIYDRDDSRRAVKEAIKAAGLDPKQTEPGKILNIISREKGNLETHKSFAERREGYFAEVVSDVWERYEAVLRGEKALDFDDLLLKTAVLLGDFPDVLNHYQKIWRYIHIDEYQDTNRVQYAIVKLLASRERRICVVGDIDQNIYTWRGATLRNLMSFEEDYKEAKVVRLEQNYRSTKIILRVANNIIEKNVYRLKKALFTENPEGEKLGIYVAADEADEACFAAGRAKELMESGVPPSEVAVLFRANFQSRVLEEAFLTLGLPYQVLGTRFFERKEIKDTLSYLRLSLNPESAADLKRIINVPPRGLGKVALIKVLVGREGALPAGAQKKVAAFKNLLSRIGQFAESHPASETVSFVLKSSGLKEELGRGGDEDKERLENLGELVSLSAKYDALPGLSGVEKLLEDAALATDQDEIDEKKEVVRLMTVHASKGLEFDYVFIVGLENDLFPHRRLGEEGLTSEESEEERRLFYVALTRARRKVFLSYASFRTIFGERQVNMPSEFITDIDDVYLEVEERGEWGNHDKRPGKVIYF
ncbi:MAG: UvrD-helicase domain-containing protein [Candidatus Taylorbacteria bacterium]|nr:UvrD-helicase domain-containing protein [Candidatus Taylorbacteria bacterium]